MGTKQEGGHIVTESTERVNFLFLSLDAIYARREDGRGESRRCIDLSMGNEGCQARSNPGSDPISHLCMAGGHSAVVTLRRQLSGVGSLPPRYGFQRMDSDH